jgi:hypothetical protein
MVSVSFAVLAIENDAPLLRSHPDLDNVCHLCLPLFTAVKMVIIQEEPPFYFSHFLSATSHSLSAD